MNIDWNEAPEGATAWDARPHAEKTWMRRNWRPNRGWDYWGINHWIHYGEIPEEQERQMIHRPLQQPWNGEGLPPVGTVCEVKGCISHYLKWNKVTVFAVRGYTVFFDMEDGRWGQTDSHEFRPLRTPEQRAAEERAKAIEAMAESSLYGHYAFTSAQAKIACTVLYDAGYRKFEIVDEEEKP